MSNGCNSPVFFGKTQNAENLQEIKITPQVKKIRGTKVGAWPTQFIFEGKDGNEISKIDITNSNFAPDQILEDDE